MYGYYYYYYYFKVFSSITLMNNIREIRISGRQTLNIGIVYMSGYIIIIYIKWKINIAHHGDLSHIFTRKRGRLHYTPERTMLERN